MSGVQTRGSAALEAERAEVGNLLTGGHELLEDDVTEDLKGADTASDNNMEALIPPNPPDYVAAA